MDEGFHRKEIEPKPLDIISVHGRWAQVSMTDGIQLIVRWLYNNSSERINLKDYILSEELDAPVWRLQEQFNPRELINIQGGPEEKNALQLKVLARYRKRVI